MRKFFLFFLIFILFLISNSKAFSSNEETLIIFDASASMLEDFKGESKYIIAIEQAKNVLNTLPNTKKIGLRIIGISFDESLLLLIKNPAELCKSTKLVVPIRQNSINHIKSSLDSLFPLGTTPLTYTLEKAITYDFSYGNHLKHIILVTDGGESCNGDPCKYIRELMQTRQDIKIDILAIDVSGEDFKQLKCLTDSTFGSIINIEKPKEITDAFNKFLNTDFNSVVQTKHLDSNKREVKYKNYMIEVFE